MAKKKTGTKETQPELDLSLDLSSGLGNGGNKVKCSTCPEGTPPKNQGEFPRDRSKKSGYAKQCKSCRRQYRKDNAIALAEQRKKYRARPENRYKTYKESAVYRGYEWLLTNAEFMVHWQKPCVYCNSEISTIGLDRKNPELPYQANNVEPACSGCNRMKSDLTREDFLEHIRKIHKHSC